MGLAPLTSVSHEKLSSFKFHGDGQCGRSFVLSVLWEGLNFVRSLGGTDGRNFSLDGKSFVRSLVPPGGTELLSFTPSLLSVISIGPLSREKEGKKIVDERRNSGEAEKRIGRCETELQLGCTCNGAAVAMGL